MGNFQQRHIYTEDEIRLFEQTIHTYTRNERKHISQVLYNYITLYRNNPSVNINSASRIYNIIRRYEMNGAQP
jgi:hypothetical protein